MVQAIAQSPDWSSTARFITYDEGGGFWDHVAPPVKTDYGYGTRIPTVIVSPYAATCVFSQQTTNTSIPAFMEKLWHMKQNDFMAPSTSTASCWPRRRLRRRRPTPSPSTTRPPRPTPARPSP